MGNNIILHSTGCPRCKIIKMKLDAKNIKYTENNSVDKMMELGIKSAPSLEIDGEILDFNKSLNWIKEQM